MSIGYQLRDFEVVDYQLWGYRTAKRSFILRGPKPVLRPNSYISCVGGAFTFGCFVEDPWPTLLGNSLGMDVLNLGQAGAGPKWFNRPEQSELIDLINGSCVAIIMVMSGRSDENSRLENEQGLELLSLKETGESMFANAAWNRLLDEHDNNEVLRLVQETRINYCHNFVAFLQRITAPKLLFWFSQRKPEYQEEFTRFHSLSGGFPELVNRALLDNLLPYVDDYVECITSKGRPHVLINRFTGLEAKVNHSFTNVFANLPSRDTLTVESGHDPLSVNIHYPTPGMHCDAALALEPNCRQLLSSNYQQK